MNNIPYDPPAFHRVSFNCPHCNAYSHQKWCDTYYYEGVDIILPALQYARCVKCNSYSLWHFEKMLYPEGSGEPPNQDLDDDIKVDYLEARSIANKSPRGAASLLRLCVQKLCKQLGEKGKDINEDIGNLVSKGLPVKIQQSLDIVRVIGNNAVHPGQIDLKDDVETANKLFKLVNIIAFTMITHPKEIADMFDEKVPQTAKDGISKRDT